jgi:hypothetical protein
MEDPWAIALRNQRPAETPRRVIQRSHKPEPRVLGTGALLERTDSTTFDFEHKGKAHQKQYRRSGNVEFDSTANRAERTAVRKRAFPAFRLAAKKFFATVGLAGSDLMSKEVYLSIHFRISRCLAPDLSKWEAYRHACEDWWFDSRYAGEGQRFMRPLPMTIDQFANSLFVLADMWTNTIDEEAYLDFTQKLFRCAAPFFPGAGFFSARSPPIRRARRDRTRELRVGPGDKSRQRAGLLESA